MKKTKTTTMKKKAPKPPRMMGDIMLDMEPLLLEMAIDQDLQWGEILHLVYGYLKVHVPGGQEEYLDGSHPEFYYGPKK